MRAARTGWLVGSCPSPSAMAVTSLMRIEQIVLSGVTSVLPLMGAIARVEGWGADLVTHKT